MLTDRFTETRKESREINFTLPFGGDGLTKTGDPSPKTGEGFEARDFGTVTE